MAAETQAIDVGEKKESKSAIAISIAIAVALLMIPLVFFVAGALVGSGPNQKGRTAQQPINDGPNSPVKSELQDYTRFALPDQYIADNTDKLDQVVSTLNKLRDSLNSDSPSIAIKNVENKDAIVTKIGELQNVIQSLRQAIAQKNTPDATTFSRQLRDGLNAIDMLAAGNPDGSTLVDIGKKVVEFNKDGHGSIAFGSKSAVKINKQTGYPDFLDSSAFMSFILYKAGIFRSIGQRVDVSGLLGFAKNKTYGFTLVMDSTTSISPEEIQSAIDSHTIVPGDMLLSGKFANDGSLDTKSSHVVMYTGDTGDKALIQSNIHAGKNGPQYVDLNDRLTRSKIVAVVRPPQKAQ